MILAVVVTLFLCLYFYIWKRLRYWEIRGIPSVKPSFFKKSSKKFTIEETECRDYKLFANKSYYGVYDFLRPVLLIRDPELIKVIMVKRFDAVTDHRELVPSYIDPIWARNVFTKKAKDGWHELRATVSPSFTSSKLKTMFELMQKSAEECVKHYKRQGGTVEIEAKDLFSRFTTDVMSTTVFGVSCNSYEQPENQFYLMAKQTVDFSGIKAFKFIGYSLIPRIMQFLQIRIFNKELVEFFSGLINESIRLRRENKLIRYDMIHLLMEAQKGNLKHDTQNTQTFFEFSAVEESDVIKYRKKMTNFTDNDIIGVGMGFVLAGYDTTSGVLSFVIYELAVNPEVQDRLFKEVVSASRDADGKLTYEDLLRIKYLDMVISETMRKWPAAWKIDRQCIKSVTLEPKNNNEKPIVIEKGLQLKVPIFAIHRDEQYYPNPEKFDPERFNDENKHNIKPFTYMPFGVGPRSCMGSRFALLEMKIVVAEIIQAFKIVPIRKSPIPLYLTNTGFSHGPAEGFWFGLEPRASSA